MFSKNLKKFLVIHILRGWHIRIIHIVLCCVLYFVMQSRPFEIINISIINQLQILASSFGYRIEVLNELLVQYKDFLFLGLLGFSILFFNLTYSTKTIWIQLLAYLIKFIGINVFGVYLMLEYKYQYPFLQLNMIAFVETQFSLGAKLSRLMAEYNFVRKTFGKFVDHNIIDDFLATSKSFKYLSESKNMSVMFTDIRDFSTISEDINPDDLIRLLNIYFDEMSKLVYGHNGSVDKFIGDSVMALWNGSTREFRHSSQAVICAMKMVKKLKQLKNANPEFEIFNIGIGVNTGQMVLGNIGGNNKYDYTVFGDNVNVASRIESLNKKYHTNILCSQSTVEHCQKKPLGDIIFRKIDVITVKGKTNTTSIYQPLPNTPRNQKFKQTYEIGLDLYIRGAFEQSITYFHQLALKGDRTSQIMITRINQLIVNPPKNWTGIHNWEEK